MRTTSPHLTLHSKLTVKETQWNESHFYFSNLAHRFYHLQWMSNLAYSKRMDPCRKFYNYQNKDQCAHLYAPKCFSNLPQLLAHTHTRTHAHTHVRTHAHTHTRAFWLCNTYINIFWIQNTGFSVSIIIFNPTKYIIKCFLKGLSFYAVTIALIPVFWNLWC